MTLFASIFVPDFSVEALLRAEPELRSQAVVVLEGKVPLQKVFAVNEKARHAGAEAGMTKIQVEACTELVLCLRSAVQETAAHAALLDCAQSFSPRVEDTSCDTVVLDLAGMKGLFGPPSQIAAKIARHISDIGLEASVAVAANPDTAMLAARGFHGITVIARGKEAKQLGSLPVEVFFASNSVIRNEFQPTGNLLFPQSPRDGQHSECLLETFERWGIRDLRALAALPEIEISERLGQEGVFLQKLARGATARTLVPVEPPLVFEEAVELEYPLQLLEPLAFLLHRMLENVCARLAARALATQELQLRLELENWHSHENETDHVGAGPLAPLGRAHARQVFTRTLRLPVPLLDAKVFLKLLQLELKAHPPGAPIVKIYLAAKPVRPRAAQNGLFLPPSPEPEKLELTLAKIAGIVGEHRSGSPQLLDTHRPQGFRMQRFVSREPERSPEKPESMGDLITALRIFRPPVPAVVTMREGSPARILCPMRAEIQGEILWSAGPWRSSGDWWEQKAWSQHEWDIALQQDTGVALYRMVRDLLHDCWLIEGTYD